MIYKKNFDAIALKCQIHCHGFQVAKIASPSRLANFHVDMAIGLLLPLSMDFALQYFHW